MREMSDWDGVTLVAQAAAREAVTHVCVLQRVFEGCDTFLAAF